MFHDTLKSTKVGLVLMFGNLLKSQCVNHYDLSQIVPELNYIHKLWQLDNQLLVCTE
jgi:hypothetical protein